MKSPIKFNKIFRFSLLTSLIFFLLYNVSFKLLEVLTTARIAILILILWALKERVNFIATLKSRVWILFLPLPYVALQYLIIGDFGQLSRFLHLALYSFIGAGLVVSISGDLRVLLSALLIAVSVQAVIILVSFVSVDYRVWFDAIAVSGANYDATYIYRAPGFSGAGGAALSLIQSLGVFFGWLLLRKNKIYENIQGKLSYLVFLAMVLSVASCLVVGRTGLLLSLIFMVIFLIDSPSRVRFSLVLVLSTFLIQLFLFKILPNLLDNQFSFDYFNDWAFGFFVGKDETISFLDAQPIKSLSVETFHGTGLTSIVNGKNPSDHDSGFIQTYYSMGFPFAVIFYAIYVYVLFTALRWLPFLLRVIFVILFYALEIKEPFIFKYSLMFILMILYFSHNRIFSANPYALRKYLNR